MKSLSILIPVFNEEESLLALFSELKNHFENNSAIEVIFINDGSSDQSQYLIEKANVAVVPGSAFGSPGYIRLSYATSLELIKEAVNRISNSLD